MVDGLFGQARFSANMEHVNQSCLAAPCLAGALLLWGCGAQAPRAAIDPELASSVPASAGIVAGVRVEAVRSSPLFARLPAAARALIEPIPGGEYLLIALTADGPLFAAVGKFPHAPAGTTLLTPRIALSGSEAAIRSALEAHRAGSAGRGTAPGSELIALAEPLAARFPIWLAARGAARLPLTGNPGNLNNLLALTRFTAVGFRPDDPVSLEATGICRSPEAARRLEETVRAIISLASAGRKAPAYLEHLEYRTEGSDLHLTAAVPLAAVDALWR
jgi:hypothetical protein